MKKLLIISIILVAAGLSLILYSDPILLQPGGSQQLQGGGPTFINSTSTSGGSPGNCHISSGVTICSGNGLQALSDTNAIIETIAGIGLCGVGLFLTAIETISEPQSPYQTKAVT